MCMYNIVNIKYFKLINNINTMKLNYLYVFTIQ